MPVENFLEVTFNLKTPLLLILIVHQKPDLHFFVLIIYMDFLQGIHRNLLRTILNYVKLQQVCYSTSVFKKELKYHCTYRPEHPKE